MKLNGSGLIYANPPRHEKSNRSHVEVTRGRSHGVEGPQAACSLLLHCGNPTAFGEVMLQREKATAETRVQRDGKVFMYPQEYHMKKKVTRFD